jgi:hypothetical protein
MSLEKESFTFGAIEERQTKLLRENSAPSNARDFYEA